MSNHVGLAIAQLQISRDNTYRANLLGIRRQILAHSYIQNHIVSPIKQRLQSFIHNPEQSTYNLCEHSEDEEKRYEEFIQTYLKEKQDLAREYPEKAHALEKEAAEMEHLLKNFDLKNISKEDAYRLLGVLDELETNTQSKDQYIAVCLQEIAQSYVIVAEMNKDTLKHHTNMTRHMTSNQIAR